MPDLADLSPQLLVLVFGSIIVVTALGGWLYASGAAPRPNPRVRRTRLVHADEEPTRPLTRTAVAEDLTAPMATSSASLLDDEVGMSDRPAAARRRVRVRRLNGLRPGTSARAPGTSRPRFGL